MTFIIPAFADIVSFTTCRYYPDHRNKTVVYYYATTVLGYNYAVNGQDFHYNVVKEFEWVGWCIEPVYHGYRFAASTERSGCTMMRSVFSSTTPLPESKYLCRSSIARTMKTLSLLFSQPVSPTVATGCSFAVALLRSPQG